MYFSQGCLRIDRPRPLTHHGTACTGKSNDLLYPPFLPSLEQARFVDELVQQPSDKRISGTRCIDGLNVEGIHLASVPPHLPRQLSPAICHQHRRLLRQGLTDNVRTCLGVEEPLCFLLGELDQGGFREEGTNSGKGLREEVEKKVK